MSTSHEIPPTPLQPRDDNIVQATVTPLHHENLDFLGAHKLTACTETAQPKVVYPKLPSEISLPRQQQSHLLRYRDAIVIPSRTADCSVPSRANVGRKRANATSLINSPARTSQREQSTLVFQQAQETIKFQNEARRLMLIGDTSSSLLCSSSRLKTRLDSTANGKCSSRNLRFPIPEISHNSRIPNWTHESTTQLHALLPSTRSKHGSTSSLPPLTKRVTTRPLRLQDHGFKKASPRLQRDLINMESSKETKSFEKRGMTYSEREDAGDWSEDENYFLSPPIRNEQVQHWLEDIQGQLQEYCELPPSIPNSFCCLVHTNQLENHTSGVKDVAPASSITRKLKDLPNDANKCDQEGIFEMQSDGNEKRPLQQGLATHLLGRPALRSQRIFDRVAPTKSVESLKYHNPSPLVNEKTKATLKAKVDVTKRIIDPSVRQSISKDGLLESLSSDEAAQLTLSVPKRGSRHRSSSPIPIPNNTGNTTSHDDVGGLTPDVQITRKGKGRKCKKGRCPSYYDEDILSSSPPGYYKRA